MKFIKSLAFLCLVFPFASCKSTFKVEVSIFKGPASELRAASDAYDIVRAHESAFVDLAARSKVIGLDDGTAAERLVRATAESAAIVAAGAKLPRPEIPRTPDVTNTVKNAYKENL